MNITSLLKKYILPKDIDFVKMLQKQSKATNDMISDLYNCFIMEKHKACEAITEDEHRTKNIKSKNMNQLLNAFITPIDRESIYRAVTQLDWITLTVKEFVLETKAYDIHNLGKYKKMFDLILEASNSLNEGFAALSDKDPAKVNRLSDKTRKLTEQISQEYILEMVELSGNDNIKEIFIYREILVQLKEIGKRIHVSANTLQDIIVKMD